MNITARHMHLVGLADDLARLAIKHSDTPFSMALRLVQAYFAGDTDRITEAEYMAIRAHLTEVFPTLVREVILL